MYILILSRTFDTSTANVIDWLKHYKIEYFRVNESNIIKVKKISISSNLFFEIEIENKTINLEDICAFWYRQSNFKIYSPPLEIKKSFVFKDELLHNLKNERKKVIDFFHFKLLQKRALGDFFNTDLNKLIVLDIAKSLGIKIPHTLITIKKKELLDFIDIHGEIICKAISESISFHDDKLGGITNYTNCLTKDVVESLNSTFSMSLFQNKVIKKYELRIFYIDNQFYPMAIFSQLDTKTNIDFRRYNYDKPNRKVPYNLPKLVQDKLHTLMKMLNLKTGSIDMAINDKNDYVFFEVNPIGQYGMTSIPCNYYLDKKIAEYLTHKGI